MRFGNRVLLGLEKRFGKLAFPAILRWIAGFQFLVLILVMASPGVAELLQFDRAKIMSGEVWRLASWVIFPGVTQLNPHNILPVLIFSAIMMLFTFFINDIIEDAIGTFRLNVYVLTVALFLTIGAMSPFSNPFFTVGFMNFTFFSAMIFAAACFLPNHTIMLMMVIPIKLKWLAWIDVAWMVFRLTSTPVELMPYNTILVLFGLLPFLVGIFPPILTNLKNEATASTRRAKFQRDANGGNAFHTCHLCGVTDVKDPDMEFRVSADDGEEYCLPCREKQG